MSKKRKKSKDYIPYKKELKDDLSKRKGFYINKTPTKQHKNSCMYRDKETNKCTNIKCHATYCQTAHNCTCYKRIEKPDLTIKARESSNGLIFDESYTNIEMPVKSGIHEQTDGYGMSKKIGTQVHIGYIKGDGNRRHKARCIYYIKDGKRCKLTISKCNGSSHCKKYREKQ